MLPERVELVLEGLAVEVEVRVVLVDLGVKSARPSTVLFLANLALFSAN